MTSNVAATATAIVATSLLGSATTSLPVSGGALHASCEAYALDPRTTAASMCIAYVNGFLDSAILAGVLVERVEPRRATAESFAERALRTRVGSRAREDEQVREPEYCAPESVSVPHVLDQLLRYVRDDPPRRETSARELLDAVLKQIFPCEVRG